ncbi:MAG: Holliday junction branch migration protein RuvA [Ignavibacteriaceae bacterium]|nr:Holliday junction branch migration protein RuvA [Ignavibacteriaceae bacterium]
MIGFLTGKIISAKPTQLLLDVNGVGYSVLISINTFEKISGKDTASLHIYTNVKEDSISLFGFFTEAEKDMFEILISVSGVGPKSALGLLSGISVENLKHAIIEENVARIVAVPGIGRKTAERLILELKSKVGKVEDSEVAAHPSSKQEAISALTTLGYNIKYAENAVIKILSAEPDCGLEDLIKKTLSELNR